MPDPSEGEADPILSSLASLSLSETSSRKRDFCLTPPHTPSSTSSASQGEADELEWAIDTLEERMAAHLPNSAAPGVPPEDDPDYEYMLYRAQVYQQWWNLPALDLNEGNNRTRFRAAYYRIAFASRPDVWVGMTSWEMIWEMYEWGKRLQQSAAESLKLAEFSMRNQDKLKQLPSDFDSGFTFIFKSEGRVAKVHNSSDFCQGKLIAYDGIGREVKEQANIVKKLNAYKLKRKTLQETNKFVYREAKRFHDGQLKLAHWMVLQEPNEDLGDADAYKSNAITHLRLTQFRTPDFNPDEEEEESHKEPSTPITIPDRKYSKLRKPSPRVIRLGTQESLEEQFLGRTITEKLGAPGRPDARVRRRIGEHKRMIIIHNNDSKRAQRQLHYAQIRKTKTERILASKPYPFHDPVDELNKLHWVLDDEGVFREYEYIQDGQDFQRSHWREMLPVGVIATTSVGQGRRFSMDEISQLSTPLPAIYPSPTKAGFLPSETS